MCGNEVLRSHHLVYLLVEVTLKAQVSVGDDAHEMVVIIHHGNASDVIVVHHLQGILHGATLVYGHRVVYHSVLGTLHDGHLTGLFLDGHVLVYHTDASLTGYGNGHGALRNSVHGSCDKGHVKRDVARKAGFQLYFLGKYF